MKVRGNFILFCAAMLLPGSANAAGPNYTANPFVFIGTASQCNPSPAGHPIVTAGWIRGMGLPDDGISTIANEKKTDRNTGLLLNKNGPTPDCSAAGAEIKPWKSGTKLNATKGLGFDYRIGTHCGAGAPRFNVTTTDGKLYFVGCSYGTHSPAPQDAQWERVVVTDPAEFFPGNTTTPFNFDMPIKSISIIFDEGTDTPGANDPAGVGLVVLDNININGSYITNGSGEIAN
jgi:hypothetical protein